MTLSEKREWVITYKAEGQEHKTWLVAKSEEAAKKLFGVWNKAEVIRVEAK